VLPRDLPWSTDPAEYVVVVGEVRLADLAAVDAGRVEIYVVGQAHGGGGSEE
jgi:hypothetical protein